MKIFSYVTLALTLALAFTLWLSNDLAFTIFWTVVLFLPVLAITDLIAIIYLIRHRKDKAAKSLAALLVAIPVVAVIGYYLPWHSVSDKTMSAHFRKHEKEIRELVTFAESLSDSVTIKFPSKPQPEAVSEEAYRHTMDLLKQAHCEGIETYSRFDSHTIVHFRAAGFKTNGYIFHPDGTVKILRWDPLGSDSSGEYDLLP